MRKSTTMPLNQPPFSWRPITSAFGLVLLVSGCPMHTSQVRPGHRARWQRIMATTLTWLMQVEGAWAGGFFATHPATDDRIQRVQA